MLNLRAISVSSVGWLKQSLRVSEIILPSSNLVPSRCCLSVYFLAFITLLLMLVLMLVLSPRSLDLR